MLAESILTPIKTARILDHGVLYAQGLESVSVYMDAKGPLRESTSFASVRRLGCQIGCLRRDDDHACSRSSPVVLRSVRRSMRERDEVAACEFGLKMRGSRESRRYRPWRQGPPPIMERRYRSCRARPGYFVRRRRRVPEHAERLQGAGGFSPPPRLAARSQRRREAIEALDKLFNG